MKRYLKSNYISGKLAKPYMYYADILPLILMIIWLQSLCHSSLAITGDGTTTLPTDNQLCGSLPAPVPLWTKH